jgi:hypothetical protein
MKRIAALLLVLCCAGCGSKQAPATESASPIATEPALPVTEAISEPPATEKPGTAIETPSFSVFNSSRSLNALEHTVEKKAESFEIIEFDESGYYYRSDSKAGHFDFSAGKSELVFDIPALSYSSGRFVKNRGDFFLTGSLESQGVENDFIFSLSFGKQTLEELYHWTHNVPVSQLGLRNDDFVAMYIEDDGNNSLIYKIDEISGGIPKLLWTSAFDKDKKSGLQPIEKIHAGESSLTVLGVDASVLNECRKIEIDYSGNVLSDFKIDIGDFLDLNSYYGGGMTDFFRDFHFYKDFLLLITQHGRVLVLHEENGAYQRVELPNEFSEPLFFNYLTQSALQDQGVMRFVTSFDTIIYTIDLNDMTVTKTPIAYDNEMADFVPFVLLVNELGDCLLVSKNYVSANGDSNLSFFGKDLFEN